MRSLQVDVVGGGPGGLFLARLLRLADANAVVRVHERDGPDDYFGFGVVFSDRTMSSLMSADPQTCALMQRASVSWPDLEIRLPGAAIRYGGYGFTAISRQVLLHILQGQAAAAGAELHFHEEWSVGADAAATGTPSNAGPHVIVLADGANSANRDRLADRFGTTADTGTAKYIWFGTQAAFDAVTFPFVITDVGAFAAHAYPHRADLSTFIVETDERTWRRAGLDAATEAAVRRGQTDDHSRELLSAAFAEHLGGHPLIGNNSKWASFRVIRNTRWSAGSLVLLGDAAHTAHFSVGSGTKLAMEDAIALAGALARAVSVSGAFARYESARRPAVARTQALAERSMRWWESFGRRMHLPPHRFGMHFITRTGAISYPGLRRRHGDRIVDAEAELTGHAAGPDSVLSSPVRLGPIEVPTRIAVRLPGDPRRQAAMAAGCAVGGSLLLADWRGHPPDALDEFALLWCEATAEVAAQKAVLGIVVDEAAVTGELHRAVHTSGARLVEVSVEEANLDSPAVAAMLDAVGDPVAVCVGLPCPALPAWSTVDEPLLRACRALAVRGTAALHLRASPATVGEWGHRIAWADRIRTETGLPVLLDGPDRWAFEVRGPDADDDWGARLHAAVVGGRLDMVVTGP